MTDPKGYMQCVCGHRIGEHKNDVYDAPSHPCLTEGCKCTDYHFSRFCYRAAWVKIDGEDCLEVYDKEGNPMLAGEIEETLNKYAALEDQNRWRPVSELPNVGETVLLALYDGKELVGYVTGRSVETGKYSALGFA